MRPIQLKINAILIFTFLLTFVFGGLASLTYFEIVNENKTRIEKLTQEPEASTAVFLKNWQNKTAYNEKKLYAYTCLLFATVAIGLLLVRFIVISQVFNPLFNTTVKMMDFLNGKFTYDFGTPTSDEMGQLQNTFNSMAQEVLQNMEELKTLDEAKSDFLNIASHELRTPMTSIKGSLGLLTSGAMGNLPEDVMGLMKIAESETDRLIRLTNDILDMAKIEARKMPLKQNWISLENLIYKTAESLQGLLNTSNVKIKIRDFDSTTVYADEDRIQQVLTNLLSNAIKFSPPGKAVEIAVDLQIGKPLRINVRDKGKGLTPEQKSILFQKFRQATTPDNPLVKGTGLGLAIARALVEEHAGQIGVDSIPNAGSTFYFTLPQWKFMNENEKAAV